MLVAVAALGLPARSAAAGKLESYREAFDEKLNAVLDEHVEAARELRKNYLRALEKLKNTLGREEKLKSAAEVLAEIEAVEEGELAADLPAGANYRLRQLREKWEKELAALSETRDRKILAATGAYFKALKAQERELTRSGKIREALRFEEEARRMAQIPEVKAARERQKRDEEDDLGGGLRTEAELERLLVGTTWRYRKYGPQGLTRELELKKNSVAVFGGNYHAAWEVRRGPELRISREDWPGPAVLKLDSELTKFEGTASDGAMVSGRRLSR